MTMELHVRRLVPGGDWAVMLAGFTAALMAVVLALTRSRRIGSRMPWPRPRQVPFGLLHTMRMAIDANGFLAGLRDRYPEGVFSLRLCGQPHHFLHGPRMATTLLNRPVTEAETLSAGLLVSNFGFSEGDRDHHARLAGESRGNFRLLMSEPGLGGLVAAVVGYVRGCASRLVCFDGGEQPEWARMAGAHKVASGVVEADLMELARNFVALTANKALFGSDFVDNMARRGLWESLWTFDEGFLVLGLAARLPAWVSWPRLTRVKTAQRRLVEFAREFVVAMDKEVKGLEQGGEWKRLGDVSAFVSARHHTYRSNELSLAARASSDLALLWAMNANANLLVPWMLLEIYKPWKASTWKACWDGARA
ncbi:hypothetical protein CDD80_3839 [Ophiocordyceps camponoti-rufipedis]|uniref:Cytochrome P450 n=1 Tax=Ophiocordyceps camponoti-rufipedis TaxID=2004952 RepID=A0A2C5YXC6_9HYPO|nr:hypothetical protein CDD80_3839 [Ophiocordyceps camponoti-rufipedis]